MRLVAYIELAIFARVLIGALTLRNALISPLIYAHFLRQRYYQSAFTREAVATVNDKINGLIRREGTPPVAVMVWDRLQMFVQRWVGTTLESNEEPGPGEETQRR
jgi:transmembrane protein 33